MEDNIIERSFTDRPQDEQEALLTYTWCNYCMEVDLGMQNVKEYQSEDRVWLEGDCIKCNNKVITEIDETED
ncbi:hypothetical protein CBF23_010780 [Marinomonas agarivorans]|nr:hypothetical protein CBF23_010780 [Marinomonas agarivorans]